MGDGQNRDKGTQTPARFVIGGLTLLGSLERLIQAGRGRCAIAAEPSWTKIRYTNSNHQFSHKNDSPSQATYLSEISLHLVHHFTTLRPAIMLLLPIRWIPGLRFSWTSPRWPADIEFVRTASWNSKEASWLKKYMDTLRFNLSWLAWLAWLGVTWDDFAGVFAFLFCVFFWPSWERENISPAFCHLLSWWFSGWNPFGGDMFSRSLAKVSQHPVLRLGIMGMRIHFASV